MIDLTTFDCTGCTACYSICPHKAIQMETDVEGFKFPKINTQKCTNCGLCEKVCIPSKGYKKQPFKTEVYGAKNKNLEERKQSQSGGAFFVLAKHILEKNGAVYGAFIDDEFIVRHKRADVEQEAKVFRGSKYTQSDLGDVFSQVKEDLRTGVLVLFSGTPCQVAGLKSFLQKDYENLILMDLICHGVPSPKVWKDYMQWQQQNFKKKTISHAQFRDVDCPWGVSYESFLVNGKKERANIYANIFYSRNAQRKSCYTCPFANTERLSDITVGDYWGIENVNPAFRDDSGVSVVLINSEKGKRLWSEIKECFDYFQGDVEGLLPRNPQLREPASRPSTRERFWQDYEKGFSYVARRYGGNTLKRKIKNIIKKILKKN